MAIETVPMLPTEEPPSVQFGFYNDPKYQARDRLLLAKLAKSPATLQQYFVKNIGLKGARAVVRDEIEAPLVLAKNRMTQMTTALEVIEERGHLNEWDGDTNKIASYVAPIKKYYDAMRSEGEDYYLNPDIPEFADFWLNADTDEVLDLIGAALDDSRVEVEFREQFKAVLGEIPALVA